MFDLFSEDILLERDKVQRLQVRETVQIKVKM